MFKRQEEQGKELHKYSKLGMEPAKITNKIKISLEQLLIKKNTNKPTIIFSKGFKSESSLAYT